jgi:hypothetical protein
LRIAVQIGEEKRDRVATGFSESLSLPQRRDLSDNSHPFRPIRNIHSGSYAGTAGSNAL